MLQQAMACFALRGIDLTKIESRPMRSSPLRELPSSFTFTTNKGSPEPEGDVASDSSSDGRRASFNYLFYLDFAASLKDRNALNALRHLQVLIDILTFHFYFRECVSSEIYSLVMQEIAIDLRVLGSYPMDERLSQS